MNPLVAQTSEDSCSQILLDSPPPPSTYTIEIGEQQLAKALYRGFPVI